MNYKNDYKHTIFWALLTLFPFLLQSFGLFNGMDYSTTPLHGPLSIFTGVLIHGTWRHMIGNLLGMLLGVSILVKFYPKAYRLVMFLGYLLPPIIMYFFSPVHSVGISGLVFTVLWFVIISGLTSNYKEKFYTSIAVLMIYGSSLHTVVPTAGMKGIAWQSHLTGVCVAMMLVIFYKLKKIY